MAAFRHGRWIFTFSTVSFRCHFLFICLVVVFVVFFSYVFPYRHRVYLIVWWIFAVYLLMVSSRKRQDKLEEELFFFVCSIFLTPFFKRVSVCDVLPAICCLRFEFSASNTIEFLLKSIDWLWASYFLNGSKNRFGCFFQQRKTKKIFHLHSSLRRTSKHQSHQEAMSIER